MLFVWTFSRTEKRARRAVPSICQEVTAEATGNRGSVAFPDARHWSIKWRISVPCCGASPDNPFSMARNRVIVCLGRVVYSRMRPVVLIHATISPRDGGFHPFKLPTRGKRGSYKWRKWYFAYIYSPYVYTLPTDIQLILRYFYLTASPPSLPRSR